MPTDDPDRDVSGRGTPAIPSFASLRSPRRRSPVDVLVPGEHQEPVPEATPPAAPRPPEWSDLLRLGVHVAGAVATAPVHLLRWSLREPVRGVRRLLGG